MPVKSKTARTRSTARKTTRRKTTTKGSAPSRSKARTRPSRSSTRRVSDVMTPDPVSLLETETLIGAARAMREHDIGDVVVLDDTHGRIKGIATDRDIVIRAVAEGQDPGRTTIGAVASEELVTVSPNDPVDKAVRFMRDKAIRRVLVVEGDQPVGIVSIGDLALELDERSALAEISSAPPNE